jgi:hypothetical protein
MGSTSGEYGASTQVAFSGVVGTWETEFGVVEKEAETRTRGFLKLEISWSPDFEKGTFEDALPALQSDVPSY